MNLEEEKSDFGKHDIITYLKYLQNRHQESSSYFEYIIDQLNKLEFDLESGKDIIDQSNNISKLMGEVCDGLDSIANSANKIASLASQRDIKIDKILTLTEASVLYDKNNSK